MSDREALRFDFLRSAGLAEAVRAPLPGNASTRRYERLTTPSGVGAACRTARASTAAR